MSSDVTKPPQRAAFKPERITVSSREMPAPWVINDIRIGNVSMIPRRWTPRWWRIKLGKLWRKLTWFWPRKPPVIRLISYPTDQAKLEVVKPAAIHSPDDPPRAA